MVPFACQHPKKVHNVANDTWLYVPCGKCDVCRARKSLRWTDRLEYERACHPYCIFGTLTYSEEFLPRFEYNRGIGLCEPVTGELLNIKDYADYIDSDVLNFLDNRGFLPYARISDAQKFIKRLREVVKSGKRGDFPESTDRPEDRYFRYFLCSEYGETTFRPHFHFLIFTSSKWFAEHAKGLVSSCWTTDSRHSDSKELGIVDAQNVCTSAASYVSSYVNSFTNCPLIYRHPRFRQKAIFSKAPSIGTLFQRSEEIERLFNSGSVTMSLGKRGSSTFIEFPIPKDIYSRLYPKITAFDRFSSDVLSGLYCYPVDFSEVSFQDFREHFRQRIYIVKDGITEYFKYIFLRLSESESSLHNIFSKLRRFQLQANIFGVSKRSYFDKIIRFYKDYDMMQLKDYYKYYEEYSRTCNPKEMLLSDEITLDYLKEFANSCSDSIRLRCLSILEGFGYDENQCSVSDFLSDLDYESNKDFVNLVSMSKKIVNDSRKKKAKNEYLEFRQKDSQFINYLKDYHGLSKHYERVGESKSFT